jgi:sensor domain CHASE-containing protein
LGGGATDRITLMTWGLLAISFVIFYFFGRFTLRLMRQHRDIYGLLYAIEEEEKKKGSS